MTYVILDLEWNSAYSKSRKRFVNEIFEFGAVKVDDSLNVIDSFSMICCPQIGKKLNTRVKELTGVTFDELTSSDNSYPQVLTKFAHFLGDSVLMTWSTSDLLALMENSEYFLGEPKLLFMKRYCNLQSYCEYQLGCHVSSRQLGLSACAEMAGLEFPEQQMHRATADARLSAACFRALYNSDILDQYIEDATDDEFYKKLTFKSTMITNIKNPLVDKAQMYFDCPECGTRCIRKSKWNVKSRSFQAYFVCPVCRKEFAGRVYVKQRYEGVTFTKKIVPPKEQSPAESDSDTPASHSVTD